MIRSAGLLAGLLALMTCVPALAAEDPPAVKEATAAEQAPLRALIADALKEGEVSYWDTVIQSPTNAALVTEFRKYYGLPSDFKVNYSLASTTGVVTRVEQEIAAGRVTIDVAAVASLPWVHDKVAHGQIMHYDAPQYKYFQAAFDKGIGENGYFAFNGAYVFIPMWDSERTNFKGTSYKDLIGVVPNGRMSVGDGSKSQTYLATYMGLKQVLGVDYFKQLAAMKPVLISRSEQEANELVTGQNLFGFTGMPTRAYQVNERGAKLKFLYPKEGVVLLAQAMFIPTAAPHPAAAKLWLNFMLSEAAQKIMVQYEATMSGRSNFVSPRPEYAPPIDSLNVIKIDWKKITTAEMDEARREWLSIFNP